MGAWRKPWSPRSRTTYQGLSQRSQKEKIANEQAAQRVRSRTVQNEMTGVLSRMTTNAAQIVLNSREIKVLQKAVSVVAKMRKAGFTHNFKLHSMTFHDFFYDFSMTIIKAFLCIFEYIYQFTLQEHFR